MISNNVRYDVPARVSFERVRTPFGRLEVQWLPTWTAEANQALTILPHVPTCPSGLFRQLMLTPSMGTKRCALVLKGGAPVALIGLRRGGGRTWYPVIDRMMSPDSWAPAVGGFLFPALRSVQCEVEILEWCQVVPEHAKSVQELSYYQLDLQSDYLAYWRKTKHIDRLKSAASRAGKLEFAADRPGIAAWTIRTWGGRWRANDATHEQLVIADYYATSGRYHAFGLFDNQVQCAGLTAFERGKDLVLLKTGRLLSHESSHVGTRVYHLAVEWAAERGFQTITFGSGAADSYKRWWAPAVSKVWGFTFRPTSMDFFRRGKAVMSASLRPVGLAQRSIGQPRVAASGLPDRHPA
jgi:hypothetical protein